MLFTKIQLDDFDDELARFLELLAQERLLLSKHGVTGHNVTPESAWIMMAVVNVAAVLQYGADDSVLGRLLTGPAAPSHQKKAGPRAPAPRPQAILLNTSKKDIPDTTSDVGGDEEVGEDMVKSLAGVSLNDGDEDPLTFRLAARLCFSMLEELLRRPLRPSISGTLEAVSPYITVVLTFLAQVGQRADALRRLERFLPWPNLINLFNKIPKDVDIRGDQHGFRLAGGPLPEDWCMRGMEWSGRTMFARGYFKPKSNRAKGRNDIQAVAESETDVLALSCEADDDYTSDGVIEPDGDVDPDVLVSNLSVARWRRVAVVAGWATTPRGVSGLAYDPSVPKFAILASLRTKISRWKEEAKQEAEAKKAVVHKRIAADAADPDDIEILDSEDEDVDDAGDSDVVKGLKVRLLLRSPCRLLTQYMHRLDGENYAPPSALPALHLLSNLLGRSLDRSPLHEYQGRRSRPLISSLGTLSSSSIRISSSGCFRSSGTSSKLGAGRSSSHWRSSPSWMVSKSIRRLLEKMPPTHCAFSRQRSVIRRPDRSPSISRYRPAAAIIFKTCRSAPKPSTSVEMPSRHPMHAIWTTLSCVPQSGRTSTSPTDPP